MKQKLSIVQANPFVENTENTQITNSIDDIKRINSTIEYKTESEIIINLPNYDSCRLSDASDEDFFGFNQGSEIEIYATP